MTDQATSTLPRVLRICGSANLLTNLKSWELVLSFFICLVLINSAGPHVASADETLSVANEKKGSENDRLRFTVGVRTIFQDSRGDFWFGSHGEGLCRYDGKVFEYYTTKDGLADDHILSIQEDSKGAIWVNTQHGVSRYAGEAFVSFPETQHALSAAKLTLPLPGTVQEQWRKASLCE
jgi:ligand-binding sensor domain-containing protein